jgi:hypothetical protein
MTRRTAVLLARMSWIVPLGAMVTNAVLSRGDAAGTSLTPAERGAAMGHACGLFLFYVAGAVLAVIALRQVRRHGPAGIRVPAWIGLVLNVVLIVAFAVATFLATSRTT